MKTKIVTIALIAIVLYSCGPSKATKMAEAEKAALIVTQNEGKALYENNCAKCHKLYDPAGYTAEKWTGILKWMQPKANITDEQRTSIYNYLVMNK
jgi:mono/diheme cytochrome c family protein